MIVFPAIWLRYIFFLFGGLLLFLAGLYLLNGLRHGSRMSLTAISSGLYIIGVTAIVWLTFSLLSQVDWSGSFSINLPSFNFIRFGS